MSGSKLAICLSPVGSRLVHRGQPVWPITDASHVGPLSRLAALYGAEVDWVQATTTGEPAPGPRSELVLGIGDEVREQTLMYAHLTGREAAIVSRSSFDDLERAPAIVVALAPVGDFALFERLSDMTAGSGTPCGLVIAESPAALDLEVLLRSAAAWLKCAPEVRGVAVWSFENCADERIGDLQIFGNRARTSEVRAALSQGAGVVSLVMHADGIDGQILEDRAILCALKGAPPGLHALEPRPACALAGVCHRLDISVAEATATDVLVAPESIRAQVLVLDACWALSPGPTKAALAWGFTSRMLRSGHVGTMLCSWEAVFTDSFMTAPLVSSIADGMPVGRALMAHLGSTHAASRRHRLCLLGDPRAHLPPRAHRARDEGRLFLDAVCKDRLRDPGPRPNTGVPFLRALAATYLERARAPRGIATVSSAIRRYERDSRIGNDVEAAGGPGPALRASVVRFLVRHFEPVRNIWSSFSEGLVSRGARTRCFGCGLPVNEIVCRLRVAGAADRQLLTCPACGIISDAPAGSEWAIRVDDDRTVSLDGPRPPHCAAVLTVVPPQKRLALGWKWPLGDDARLVPAFASSTPWPDGPCNVRVVVIDEACDLHSLALPWRQL